MKLETTYLGTRLKNPIIASACPLWEHLENVRRAEDAGASAVVLHSLFQEQVDINAEKLDAGLDMGEEVYAEAVSYFPEVGPYKLGPEAYLDHIRACRSAVDIPVIASLNGTSAGGWVEYARLIESAGASALELNLYDVPSDIDRTAAQLETQYIDLVKAIRAEVNLPLAVKIGPQFTAPANIARQFANAGADGLVLFNRFYQPDIDIEDLEIVPNLNLSSPAELRLRLRWTAILAGRIDADIAVTGGVHSAGDVLKCMMAGAKAAMTASAILRHGMPMLTGMVRDIEHWMDEHEYESIEQMQGSMSAKALGETAAFERANYVRVLGSYSLQ